MKWVNGKRFKIIFYLFIFASYFLHISHILVMTVMELRTLFFCLNIVAYKRVAKKSDSIQRGLRSTPFPCKTRKIENRNVSRGNLFVILAKTPMDQNNPIFNCEFGNCSAFCTPGTNVEYVTNNGK